MKFSKHQGLLNLAAFHASYTASSVRWSPSAWKNLAFFWSACTGFGVHSQNSMNPGKEWMVNIEFLDLIGQKIQTGDLVLALLLGQR